MSCSEIIEIATSKQEKSKMDCPIKISPKCHPKAPLEVFVDGKKKVITIVCSRCERTVTTVRVR